MTRAQGFDEYELQRRMFFESFCGGSQMTETISEVRSERDIGSDDRHNRMIEERKLSQVREADQSKPAEQIPLTGVSGYFSFCLYLRGCYGFNPTNGSWWIVHIQPR